ncbi:MAG: hypothetical protein IT204_11165 [Fimbriimonadaceae bacterium]|nr:hypothetical protein [Fimbriimonadaceae bacterium]
MRGSVRRLTVWLVALLVVSGASADVKLPKVFGSGMVLQRERAVPIWGWADAGEQVTVTLAGQPAQQATADAAGAWRVALPALPASAEPRTLSISGKNTITLENILVGEVWLCSGQSNMQWSVAASKDFPTEQANANYPLIRHIQVPLVPQSLPQPDFGGAGWQVCSPQTVGGWTACGYFMAVNLHKELNIPIGLINSSWGGTRIEPWVPPGGFAGVADLAALTKQVALADPRTPEYKERLHAYLAELDQWIAAARAGIPANGLLKPAPAYPGELVPLATKEGPQQQPTTLYNGMIHALVPYALRGAIWYQGESNHGEGMLYKLKKQALVEGWRQLWGDPQMPFNFVQIAPYEYGAEPPQVLPLFWEAQAACCDLPGVKMVVTNDIAEYRDIHPKNKQEVGRRLALIALANTYGKQDLVWSGPVFKELVIEEGRLRVKFDHLGGGLQSRDGQPLNWFEIVGEDVDWTKADAVIDGDSVVLTSPAVAKPTAVRFGWAKNAEMNLQNAAGLPARPFRAGTVPKRDWLALRVPQAKDLTLVLDLDLNNLGPSPKYDVDDRAKVAAGFDRVAYFLELQKPGEEMRYVYVEMDPFTQELAKLGVPTLASGAVFQQKVGNVTVISNAPGIVNGTDLQGCNIEFWPHNYGEPNAGGVPNAAGNLWDFGDQRGDPADGYGCMQVHNYEARQTIFALNQWKGGQNADLGIGNSEGRTRDWTFSANAASYNVKRLRVLVKPKG